MIYILLGEGFEEIEALATADILRRAGLQVQLVGISGKYITGGHGITVQADILLEEVDELKLKMLVLPGGLGGVKSIRSCPRAMELIYNSWKRRKYVAAICAAPTLLAELHITDGKKAVCYPGFEDEMGDAVVAMEPVLRRGCVITGASAGCAIEFALELVTVIRGTVKAAEIREQLVIR